MCVSLVAGHRTYVGYFYLECTINNAILRTFVNLLHQTRRVRHHRRHKWAWLRSETPVMHVQISRATSDVSVTSTESAASVNNHIQSRGNGIFKQSYYTTSDL